ncbi:MAG: flagellar hook protein FlgE [Caulobacteraceae bacterium]
MSLGAALNSAVSGLSAQSAALSVISANIANASTTGYKTATTSFDTLVAANVASAGGTSDGEGVSTSETQAMSTQGEITSTSVTTNMAIDGSGYFVASASATGTSAGTDVYTRDGSWAPDNNGYLVNTSGDYLMGYATSSTGAVESSSAGSLAGLTAIQIPLTTPVTPTTTSTVVANFPADAATGATVTVPTTAIDSLGETQDVDQTWTKGAVDPTTGDTTWTLTMADPTTTTAATATTAATTATSGTTAGVTATLTFNSSGQLVSQDVNGVQTDSPSTSLGVIPVTLDLNSGATSSFNLNMSAVTQTASSADDGAITITSNTSDGTTAGAFVSASVSAAGQVTATYSNGSATTNVIVADVPIATFADQEGLTELSGSTYAATAASGSTTLSTAGTSGAGSITGEALEASTTDTATEFNKMIVAQQAYSAAAQVVTYVDKMFDSLIQAVG